MTENPWVLVLSEEIRAWAEMPYSTAALGALEDVINRATNNGLLTFDERKLLMAQIQA